MRCGAAPEDFIYRLVTVSEAEPNSPNCFMHFFFFNCYFAVFALLLRGSPDSDPALKSLDEQQGSISICSRSDDRGESLNIVATFLSRLHLLS